jgi:hypothetical protein
MKEKRSVGEREKLFGVCREVLSLQSRLMMGMWRVKVIRLKLNNQMQPLKVTTPPNDSHRELELNMINNGG